MAITSITTPFIADGILSTGVDRSVTHPVPAVRREAAPWPWPLPMDSVLAVFDDDATAAETMAALAESGIEAQGVWMVSSADGARQLRESFAGRGALARLHSLLGDENEIAAQIAVRCTRGATALLVRAPRPQLREIADSCERHGAHLLRRTDRWISEWIARPAPRPA